MKAISNGKEPLKIVCMLRCCFHSLNHLTSKFYLSADSYWPRLNLHTIYARFSPIGYKVCDSQNCLTRQSRVKFGYNMRSDGWIVGVLLLLSFAMFKCSKSCTSFCRNLDFWVTWSISTKSPFLTRELHTIILEITMILLVGQGHYFSISRIVESVVTLPHMFAIIRIVRKWFSAIAAVVRALIGVDSLVPFQMPRTLETFSTKLAAAIFV